MSSDPLVFHTDSLGRKVSPSLPQGKKNFLIDIDGTVCEDIPNEEPDRMVTAEIYPGALEFVNRLYEEGHRVWFFTSRTEDLRAITEKWLNDHGFRYHGIIFGKPRGGNYHWIDNHKVTATQYEGYFSELRPEQRETEVFEKMIESNS
jgi:hypothetical protein